MSGALRPDEHAPFLDETIDAWTAIAPEVDGSAVALFGRLEVAARWIAAVRAAILTPYQLNFAEWTTLAVLRVSGNECRKSPTELRHRVGQSSAGIARILAKLETAGWVSREADAEDGRRMDVLLTEAGRALAERSYRALQSAQSELLEPLGERERRRLVRELDRLLAVFARAGRKSDA